MVFTLYTAPVQRQPVRAWRQKSSAYRYGFVVRFFWLGLVLRFGRRGAVDDFDAL